MTEASSWRAWLKTRNRRPELMDRPDLDPRLHRQALSGLARINRVSATARQLWPELERLARGVSGRPVRVLDVACGGGDVAVGLAKLARRRGVRIDVRGCDISPTALDYARERAAENGLEVGFFEHDVLEDRLPECDAIVCSLFLHHLSSQQAARFIGSLTAAAHLSVQISDLLRTALGYAFAVVGCRVLSRSPVVHIDGPRSVAAAFTIAEVHALAARSELRDVRIARRFPERFQLLWRAR